MSSDRVFSIFSFAATALLTWRIIIKKGLKEKHYSEPSLNGLISKTNPSIRQTSSFCPLAHIFSLFTIFKLSICQTPL